MPTIHISQQVADYIEREKSDDEPPTRVLENLIHRQREDNSGRVDIDDIRTVIREELEAVQR